MPSPTPMLDLEAPLPTRARNWPEQLRWWQTLLIVGGIFLIAPGIAVLFVLHPNRPIWAWLETMGRWFPLHELTDSINPYWLPVFLLAWMAAWLLPTVIHEVAHALAGMAVGFAPQMLKMGPLRISFHGAKPRLGVERGGDLGGLCHMTVPSLIGLHRKYFFHVAMAPMANLVIGGGVIGVWRLGELGGLPIWVRTILVSFACVSILSGLLSLVPARTGRGSHTDGAILWMIATNSPKWRRRLSLEALEIQRRKGAPLESLNQRWLRNSCGVNDGSKADLAGHWRAYLSAGARDDTAAATAHLEACLRYAGIATSEFVDRLRAVASAHHAWRTRDAVKAEKWFNAIGKFATLPRILQIRTLVALLLVRNKKEEALAKWDEGLAVIKNYPPAQREEMEKSWTKWKGEILERCGRDERTTQSDSSSSAQ